jgi:hypothetical protein
VSRYWNAYQKFITLIESKLDAFLSAEGSSTPEFYALCKSVSKSGNDWGDDAVFINLLLAASEYSSFLSLMREEAKSVVEEEVASKVEARIMAGDEDVYRGK